MGKVWRYDRPQAGRYREFTQADVDIVGSPLVLADVECVAAGVEALRRVKTPPFTVLFNNRKILHGWGVARGLGEEQITEFLRSVDKWFKVGEEGVRAELREKGLEEHFDAFAAMVGHGPEEIPAFNDEMEEGIREAVEFAELSDDLGIPATFDIRLARGLDYYTGNIFETYVNDAPGFGAIASGGRYDGLVKLVGGKDLPATGFSIGVDRLFSLLVEKGAVERKRTVTRVYVAPAKRETLRYALKVLRTLRSAGIPAETDVMGRSLRKQMEYAQKMGIPFVVIVGPEEERNGVVRLRNMETGEETVIPPEKVPEALG